MPIEPLPLATVRAIGSTSVISDPCSVVKELLDNALDASASTLQIEISQNTVDVIQLKDNGHGIPSEDHACVCKHTYTSKIQTIDDLRNLGGTSFGFRGEALASIAEMSDGLTITTRVVSDVTGSCISYGRGGELIKSERTSHPVGTTLRVTNFLKNIPVRRQTALKNATNTLAKIKKLVQAYALAQMSSRFSLKVLKAKSENNNWTYAPAPAPTLADVVTKAFGREVSSSCVLKEISSGSLGDQEGISEQALRIFAFLPRSDSDLSKVKGAGQFCSVDGRPLSSTRGIGHEIAKLFKSFVRTVAAREEGVKAVSDPFLCIQISCSQGTYDVNIEPGKDDVLFENRGNVISLINRLFSHCYGSLPEPEKRPPTENRAVPKENNEFDILLASHHTNKSDTEGRSRIEQSATVVPLLEHPEEPSSPSARREIDHTRNGSNQRSRYTDPWSITRMNASFETPRGAAIPHNTMLRRTPTSSSPGDRQSNGLQRSVHISEPVSPEVLSPPSTRTTSSSPVTRRARHRTSLESSSPDTPQTNSAKSAARERDKERYGNGALDTWFQRITQSSIQQSVSEATLELDVLAPPLSELAQERFGSSNESGVTEVATNTSPQEYQFSNETENEASDNDGHHGSMDSGRGFPVLERWAAKLHDGFNPETQSELDKALDFELRKKEALRINRMNLSQSTQFSKHSSAVSHSPHNSRFLKARAALSAKDPFAAEVTPSQKISAQDPRAYLLKQQSDLSGTEISEGGNVHRHYSRRLPFERIPDGCKLYNIGFSVTSDIPLVKKQVRLTASCDSYTNPGLESEPFTSATVESLVPLWNDKLKALLEQLECYDNAQISETQFDISHAISQYSEQFLEARNNDDGLL